MKKLLSWTLLLLALVAFQCAPEAPPPATGPPEVATAAATLAPSPTPLSTPQYGQRYSATLTPSPTPPSTPQATEEDVGTAVDLPAEADEQGLDEIAKELSDWAEECGAETLEGEVEIQAEHSGYQDAQGNQVIEETIVSHDPHTGQTMTDRQTATTYPDGSSVETQDIVVTDANGNVIAEHHSKTVYDANGNVVSEELSESGDASKVSIGNGAIASGCEEEWEGVVESSCSFTSPSMDLGGAARMEFTFEVDSTGKVTGAGRYVSHSAEMTIYPCTKVFGGGCPTPLDQSLSDVSISGERENGNFRLNFSVSVFSGSIPACTVTLGDGSFCTFGPFPPSEVSTAGELVIAARDGAQVSCRELGFPGAAIPGGAPVSMTVECTVTIHQRAR